MNGHKTYRLIAIAVPAIILMLLFSYSHVCPIAESINSSDKQPQYCVEFWLNRYQTFLGVLVAIIAAWLAWRATNRQIMRIDRQIHIAQIQFSASYLENIHARIKTNYKISAETYQIFKSFRSINNAYCKLPIKLAELAVMPIEYGDLAREELSQSFKNDCDAYLSNSANVIRDFVQLAAGLDRNFIGQASSGAFDKIFSRFFDTMLVRERTIPHLLNAAKSISEHSRYRSYGDRYYGPAKCIDMEPVFQEFFVKIRLEIERLEAIYAAAATQADAAVRT